MNYKKLGKILGKIMILEGVLMIAPFIVSVIYRESFSYKLAFAVPIFLLVCCGLLMQLPKPKRETFYQKDGFALVTMAWIVMGLFGALPFVINRDIPNYVDACFEIMSGFTTTGASIIPDITVLARSSLFWRSFSHWIGGMGVLVFVLIFIPESDEGASMYLLRAESPGPQVGKLVSKMKVTTRILYLIYLGMTVLQVVILMLDKPIPGYEEDQLFFSLLTAFGCAGTGGFGFLPGSMEMFHPFSQYVVATFLILFGINFSLYYLILIGKVRSVLRSEEFRSYFILVLAAILFIFLGLIVRVESYPQMYTVEECFRHAFFQVASLMTTAGFSTTDYQVWPTLCTTVLMMLMFTGAMAGSTSGGIKLSRIVITVKGFLVNLRKLVSPRYVPKSKFEGKTLEEKTINDVFSFITLYFFLLVIVVFLLSFDPVNGQMITVVSDAGTYQVQHGFLSNFSAVVACLSNVGPAFEALGPYSGFGAFGWFSKVILMLTMLIGRLEILPVILMFHPRTWKKV